MAAIDDLKAAVATISGDLGTLSTDLTAGIAALEAAIANGNAAGIADAVNTLKDLDTNVQSMDAAVKAAVPPSA